MTYTQLIGTSGILLLLVPFLGLPGTWKNVIIVMIAIFLITLAYTRSAKRKFHKVYSTKTFTESTIEKINQEELTNTNSN